MKSDKQLQKDVMEELSFDPSLQAENIGVAVKDGVVTLSGFVQSYAEKFAAEKSALRVAGVRSVADEIEVNIPRTYSKSDLDIAKAAAHALAWNTSVPESVKVTVEDGEVHLRGEVEWDYQRTAADNAVRYLVGIRKVHNHLEIKKRPGSSDIKKLIEDALVRGAKEEAKNIKVTVDGSTVVLSGEVNSLAELNDAKWAAWAAPGVTHVDNKLVVK